MKKILITGQNSFVGNSFENFALENFTHYTLEKISLRDEKWKTYSFDNVDTILHVAGIAHVSQDPKLEKKYYDINANLTRELAEKAKLSGVSHFIFMSSIIVYGKTQEKINLDTIPSPDNFYGKSKLKAEEILLKLQDENFKVSIIRSPMIYGKNCKGNYQALSKFAKTFPVFPAYVNKRSMIHIDNLCEFINQVIELKSEGLLFPQNAEYISTSELVKTIAEIHNNKIILTTAFNPLLKILKNKNLIKKVFGNKYYENILSPIPKDKYIKVDFYDSILKTEK